MAVPADVSIGIDTAKVQVDVAVASTADNWTVSRSSDGLRQLQVRD